MSKILESVNKRDFDRRIPEVVEMLEEKQLYGTISLIKDLKYYLDLAIKEKAHNYNCQHNSNSRDNEPCCRCDSKHTKKPIFNHNLSDTLSVFHCECGNTIKVSHDIGIMNNNNAPNYCSKCGCKFDWSDEE